MTAAASGMPGDGFDGGRGFPLLPAVAVRRRFLQRAGSLIAGS